MPKFFVSENQISNNEVTIVGTDVNHIKNVLRLKIDETINISTIDSHKNYTCRISEFDNEFVKCNIVKEELESSESNINIHIYQGLPKADKLELIIEKCTEVGAKQITPVIMKRSVVKLNEKDKEKKLLRWRKIAEVAAKQSGRDQILNVNSVLNFKNIFENLKEYDIVLVAYENEKENKLKNALTEIKKQNINVNIAILIGPEGGIDDEEILYLKSLDNCRIVTLGKRILRTETAPIVMASNILYELEE